MSKRLSETIYIELEKHACPPIDCVLPEWPTQKSSAEYICIHNDIQFLTTNRHKKDYRKSNNRKNSIEDFHYCCPENETELLKSFICNSRGGSIFITGYRGSGKSSMVNHAISELQREQINNKSDKELNVHEESTSTRNNGVCYVQILVDISPMYNTDSLIESIILELYSQSLKQCVTKGDCSRLKEVFYSSSSFMAALSTCSTETDLNVDQCDFLRFANNNPTEHSHVKTETPEKEYTDAFSGQLALHDVLKRLSKAGYRYVFVFDSLDKLKPKIDKHPTNRYLNIGDYILNIIADIKFLLTESTSHQIFIVGKDVDEIWQEDQYKGYGLLESVIYKNLYHSSTFNSKLIATYGFHHWIIELIKCWLIDAGFHDHMCKSYLSLYGNTLVTGIFEFLLNVLGISKEYWTYNTGLMLLPSFSVGELKGILLRGLIMQDRLRYNTDKEAVYKVYDESQKDPLEKHALPELMIRPFISFLLNSLDYNFHNNQHTMKNGSIAEYFVDSENDYLQPATERHCRRIRNLLQYLTFKGRGIPRKVYREYYSLFRDVEFIDCSRIDCTIDKTNSSKLIFLPSAIMQKIKFFSFIVEQLEVHQNRFIDLDDKDCVSLFYIIDCVLKYSERGFSWSDIEHVRFLIDDQELNPDQDLVAIILDLLDEVIIEKVDNRRNQYRILPHIRYELSSLYLSFGPEQIDLRFTAKEMSTKIRELKEVIQNLNSKDYGKRLESIQAQIQLGDILELLGQLPDAKLVYSKAIRLIRIDLEKILNEIDDNREIQDIFDSISIDGEEIQYSTVFSYLSTSIEAVMKLGYICEVAREFGQALFHHQSALKLLEKIICLLPNDDLSLNLYSSRRTMEGIRENNHRSSNELRRLVREKLAFNDESTSIFHNFQFVSNKLHPRCTGLNIGFEFEIIPEIINSAAILVEKQWNRHEANRFLLDALEYFQWSYDTVSYFNQIVSIGEIMIRRRDMGIAANCYMMALNRGIAKRRSNTNKEMQSNLLLNTINFARLFEYLGDVVFATHGIALLETDDIELISKNTNDDESQKQIKLALSNIINNTRRTLGVQDIFDFDDLVYYYNQANKYYAKNSLGLRECDVLLKILEVRYMEIVENTHNLDLPARNSNSAEWDFWLSHNYAKVGELVLKWCMYCGVIHKLQNLLAGSSISSLCDVASKRVIDRRRIGKLYYAIGKLLVFLCEHDVDMLLLGEFSSEIGDNYDWISCKLWKRKYRKKYLNIATQQYIDNQENFSRKHEDYNLPPTEYNRTLYDYTDLNLALQKLEQAYIFLTNCPDFKWNNNTFIAGGIGPESVLWNISSKSWQYMTQEVANGLLLGGLYHIVDKIICLLEDKHLNDSTISSFEEIKQQLKVLCRAEMAYQGSNLYFEDSIKDNDAAKSSQELGILYLSAIRILAHIRHLSIESKIDSCPIEIIEEQNSLHTGGYHVDDYLALYYSFLHIASKRYLTRAIDTYYQDKSPYKEKSGAQIALGDLMLIRSDAIRCADQGKYRNRKQGVGSIVGTLKGFNKKWKALNSILNRQSMHVSDVQIEDLLQQSVEAYKHALEHCLKEIEQYIKRYPFSNDAYLAHHNVMGREKHFDVCQAVHFRHWDPFNSAHNVGMDGKVAANKLFQTQRLISHCLFNLHPVLKDSGIKSSQFKQILELLFLIGHRSPFITIINLDEGNMKDEVSLEIQWSVVSRCTRKGGSLNRLSSKYEALLPTKYFFRSYDRGI